MSEVNLRELRHELRDLLADLETGLEVEELESRLHGVGLGQRVTGGSPCNELSTNALTGDLPMSTMRA